MNTPLGLLIKFLIEAWLMLTITQFINQKAAANYVARLNEGDEHEYYLTHPDELERRKEGAEAMPSLTVVETTSADSTASPWFIHARTDGRDGRGDLPTAAQTPTTVSRPLTISPSIPVLKFSEMAQTSLQLSLELSSSTIPVRSCILYTFIVPLTKH
jgi:hypothetical protein